jgi:ferredoxin
VGFLEGKGVKISFERENLKKYHLEGNTSHLIFKDGKMISAGSLNDITVSIDLRYCKGCGICTEECPTGSLSLEKEGGRLRDVIHSSFPKDMTENRKFNPAHPLPWQELPHQGWARS